MMQMPVQPRTGGKKLPNRILFYGDTGTGKTTFGAHAPKPVFIMTPEENGLDTLIDQNLAPACPAYDTKTWDSGDEGFLNILDSIANTNDDRKTLVVDTLKGVQRLCFKKVTSDKFGGDEDLFLSYGKGPEIALSTWEKMFPLLNKIREKRGMSIIMLAHSGVKQAKNPGGEQYDQYSPLVHEKLAHTINAWSDMTLFVQRVPITKKDGMKNKATGLTNLRIVTTQQPFCIAKNRYQLPDFIEVDDEDPESVMGAFITAMQEAKKVNQQRNNQPTPATDNNNPTVAATPAVA